MITTYKSAENFLTSEEKFHIRPGLERVLAVLDILGNPQDKIKVIHIAGTNGKGSVCAILANILKCAGYKTGMYTSPHLISYTERIRINNENISDNDFAFYVDEISDISNKNNIDLTEFEILTVCAFKYFYDNNIDIAVMETGMGGRFDAVNVCKKPVLEIITSISLDHTDRLGDTIDKIAYEKAGIIKYDSAVIVSVQNRGFNVIKNTAENKNALLIKSEDKIINIFENNTNYAIINNKKYEFPLLGCYQEKNLALAVSAVNFLIKTGLKINENNLESGLKTVNWNARLQYISGRNILIDGAHNPDAAYELKRSLDLYFKNQKRIFIYSTLNTKDYKKISEILFEAHDEVYFLEFNHKNAVKFEEYKKNVNNLVNLYPLEESNIDEILAKNALKIVTGSLYMIGNIYKKITI
ncbi:MAG: bifunctional folylpolyglutamate synthase/dihydrofolate synthase [Candidatus Gastranaerophilales bacterium]|nr:bifunctional folylpolyglutamate synthase/dihydrofolate synthase [Candidatus Gastranaerophilales bacterium]